MSQKETHKRFIQKRKDNNLCILCGEPLDREGVHCRKCRDKLTKEQNETRRFLQQQGICPRCQKELLYGDEKMCPECRQKAYENVMKNRDKEQYNKQHREWAKQEHKRRIELGLCTRCGKRNADKGYRTCGICRSKDKKARYKRNYKGVKNSDKIKDGICYFCDEPVKDGYKVCEKHYKLSIQISKSDKAKAIRKELVKQGILY